MRPRTRIELEKLGNNDELNIYSDDEIATEDIRSVLLSPNASVLTLDGVIRGDIDLTPLSALKNCHHVRIWNNPSVSDILPRIVKLMPQIQDIDISETKVDELDLTPVAHLKHLMFFCIDSINIESGTVDLSPLAGLEHLMDVQVQRCGIKKLDLSPLSMCPSIRLVDLYGDWMDYVDLRPLSKLKHLLTINVMDNRLYEVDLSPFLKYKHLNIRMNHGTRLVIPKGARKPKWVKELLRQYEFDLI